MELSFYIPLRSYYRNLAVGLARIGVCVIKS